MNIEMSFCETADTSVRRTLSDWAKAIEEASTEMPFDINKLEWIPIKGEIKSPDGLTQLVTHIRGDANQSIQIKMESGEVRQFDGCSYDTDTVSTMHTADPTLEIKFDYSV